MKIGGRKGFIVASSICGLDSGLQEALLVFT
jgi:hypothetical protein